MSHQATSSTCHSATAVALTGTALAHWHCATATVADWQCPVPSATHCQWQHWSAQHWHCDWQWHWQAGRCLPVGSHCHHVTMSLHVGIGGGRGEAPPGEQAAVDALLAKKNKQRMCNNTEKRPPEVSEV